MTKIEIHTAIFDDIKLSHKKYFRTLGKEAYRICRLLKENGDLPGKAPFHYLKKDELKHKTFHAGINLPEENVDKKSGGRVIYIKENANLIRIMYLGPGHKDKRYDDPYFIVGLIESRYSNPTFIEYSEEISFDI